MVFSINSCMQINKVYIFRYLVFCLFPKYLHSITPCFKMTMIFGRDVLKYILKIFRMQLMDWIYENKLSFTSYRRHFYMNYLPK